MKKNRIVGLATVIAGLAGLNIFRYEKLKKQHKKLEENANRNVTVVNLLSQWMQLKNRGENLATKLVEEGYKKIAIYGMGCVGKLLVEELKGSEVEIVYGIDQKADSIVVDMEMYTLEEPLPEVDAVIVTVVYYFDTLEEKLWGHIKCPVISLMELLERQ